jgi:hypothetical protein
VAVVSLVWLVGLPLLTAPALFGAAGWLARAERDRGAAMHDSLGAPALRGILPPQPDIVVAGPVALIVLGLLLLPPLALWVAWAVARSRGEDA